VTSESTRGIIRMIHDAFKRGDHERFASYYDENIDWTFHAPVSVFPFAGRRVGKPALFLSLKELYEDYSLQGFAAQMVLADGDRAAVISEMALVQRATSRTIRCRVASFYRIRNGHVVEYQGFVDSFDAVEQALGRYVAV
jgi:ketosteroid isomerase-like protein